MKKSRLNFTVPLRVEHNKERKQVAHELEVDPFLPKPLTYQQLP